MRAPHPHLGLSKNAGRENNSQGSYLYIPCAPLAKPARTERRRSRTYRAVGYTTAPVLKTGWATGPMPLRA
jgi:hypothetical protein